MTQSSFRSLSYALTLLVLAAQIAVADPIDTREFGLLRVGMSQATVVERVGEPDAVTQLGSTHLVRRGVHGSALIVTEQVREAWDYVGGRSLPTRLIFSNGRLVEKVKGR